MTASSAPEKFSFHRCVSALATGLVLACLVGCASEKADPPRLSLPGSHGIAISSEQFPRIFAAQTPVDTQARAQDILNHLGTSLQEICFFKDVPEFVWPVFRPDKDTSDYLPPSHTFRGGCSGASVSGPSEIVDHGIDPKTKLRTCILSLNFKSYFHRLAFLGIGENYGLACINHAGIASGSYLIIFTHDGHQLGYHHHLYLGGELEFLPDIADILARSDDPEVISILFGQPIPHPHS